MPVITPAAARSAAMIVYQLQGVDALDAAGEYDYDLQDEETQHAVIRGMITAGIYPVEQWAEHIGITSQVAHHRLADSFFVEDFIDSLYRFCGYELHEALWHAVPQYIEEQLQAAKADAEYRDQVEGCAFLQEQAC